MSRAGDGEVVVSVILPCRNTEFYLGAQLRALADQTLTEPWELVICDNGSTDRSMAVADAFRSEFRRMTIVDASGLVGAGAVRNAGVRAAQGDLLVFCDADDVVAPDWLAAMTDGLRKHPLVSARLDHEKLNEPRLLTVRAPRVGLPNTQPAFMPYALGAALGVRRAVHEAIGGFDESYRGAGEDRDYCYRAQLAGQDLVLLPQAVVHYRHRRSVSGVFSQSRAYGRARVQLYRSYRSVGMPRPSPVRSIGGWVLAPARLPRALTARDRLLVWTSRMGKRIGRLEGSIRYHVWGL